MRSRITGSILTLALLFSTALAAQTRPARSDQQLPVEEIIRRFATAESENKIARGNYTFTQDATVLSLGEAGSITGRFQRVSDIVYDDLGNRVEKITYFPASTLSGMIMTAEDLQDLAGVQPFALTLEDLPKYQVDFVGKEKVDELNTYVFTVKPKQIRKGERYFEGRIWVDDQDLQIVKAAGQAVPETDKAQYPHFESYRENIDGKYWFPTYVYADDVLEFKTGDQRMRMIVKYTNYKKFSTGIRLGDGEVAEGEEAGADKPPASDKTQPKPAKKPPSPIE